MLYNMLYDMQATIWFCRNVKVEPGDKSVPFITKLNLLDNITFLGLLDHRIDIQKDSVTLTLLPWC